MPWTSLYDVYLYPPYDYTDDSDNNQYSSWNRTRRLHAPTFLARVDTSTSRTATALRAAGGINAGNTNDVVINMGDLEVPGAGNNNNGGKKDTLFGPNIGVVGGGPEWCEKDSKDDKNSDDDELTPEIVKDWIRKSKDPSEPTTTLQALVNLKRPTIRLLPLVTSDQDPASSDPHLHAHNQQHGLEFEFDCDAPRCFITLHAVGIPAHLAEDHPAHDSESQQASSKDANEDRLLLFETAVEGGFGKKLHLADGAILELAKLEHAAQQAVAMAAAEAEAAAAAASNPANANEGEGEGSQAHLAKDHPRKRLTFFRKKGNSTTSGTGTQSTSQPLPSPTVAAGPALAVVDAETHHRAPGMVNTDAGGSHVGSSRDAKDKKKEDEEGGVKLAIRLAARDVDDKPLRVRNEQVTYLHIVRHGPPSTAAPAAAGPSEGGEGHGHGHEAQKSSSGGDEKGETTTSTSHAEAAEETDIRPWVVKVVKREARIGPHSFHLHEIYGLTSHSAAPAHPLAPTAPTPAPEHTYPPTSEQSATTPAVVPPDDADATAECLLCLSSPREVVLLPCRHLVACRECAINMVEFGAGGTLVHSEPDPLAPAPPAPAPAATTGSDATPTAAAEGNNAAPAGDPAAVAPASPTTPAPAPPAPPVPPAPTTRRKRKPKGWFCPVCRQPYTSLLRITTTPPPSKQAEAEAAAAVAEAKRASVSSSIEPEHPLASSPTDANPNSNTPNTLGMETRGAFASLTRPGFFRGFSRNVDRSVDLGTTAPTSTGANAV